MQFLMLVVLDPDHTAADVEAAPDVEHWWSTLNGQGKWLAGNRIRPASQARTVRVRGGEVMVDEGPWASQAISGFDLIEADDWDEAIAIAAAHPQAWGGRLELRPVWPLDD